VKKSIKFVALLLIACMTFMLAGCDLFTRNEAAYYNQTVITISYADNSKIEISRREFLTAYNNYGQTLISSYGYTEEKAQEETVEALANRKILLKEAKAVAQTQEGASVNLTTAEVKELYYQTYEAMLSNAADYDETIKEDWEIEDEEEMKQDVSSDIIMYEAYSKKARPVYDSVTNSYRIQLLEEDEFPVREKSFINLDAIYDAFLEETKNNQSSAIAREEYRRYLASLQSSQKILGTNYNEEKLIKEEIKRIYSNLEENEYITKYQEYKGLNDGYSTITVSQVLAKYKAMITKSKFAYDNNLESYNKDMLESFSNVNYYINNDYFYVAHILVKFSDEQQSQYDSLAEQSNNGQGYIISADEYEKQKETLYNSIKASVRDSETGEVVSEDSVSALDVLKEVQVALSGANTNEQKDAAFRELMYKYNEDGGIMNADYPYVIGTENSQMVESFTNASRELNEAGIYGGISGLVQSEYGVHIIYYMGKCTNPYEIASDGTIELKANYTIEDDGKQVPASDVLKLDETYLNNLNNKTIFDLVFESLTEDEYSKYENLDLSKLKENYQIEIEKVADLI